MDKFRPWQEEYQKHRYLDHLSDADLAQRAYHLINNLLVLTPECKIGVDNTELGENIWRLWTHLLEEYKIRYGSAAEGLKRKEFQDFKERIIDPRIEKSSKVSNLVKSTGLYANKYLYKYQNHAYANSMFEKGIFRIAPAQYYNDSSLNHAIKDDELNFHFIPNPKDAWFDVFDPITGKKKGSAPIIGEVRLSIPTNYYVFCLSRILSPRLFLDFDADSCLIIKDPERFCKEVETEFLKQLPEFENNIVSKHVRYCDPIIDSVNTVEKFFSKHIKFYYQNEYRIVFLPPGNEEKLDPVFIHLPNIKEYCELITYNDM